MIDDLATHIATCIRTVSPRPFTHQLLSPPKITNRSDAAMLYNDRAVLENFHISQAFTLMKNEDCNILSGLSKGEYREFRSLVIDMVLATDMSSHFQQIKAMKNILNHSDNFNADKSKVLSLVIHISDISHPAKEWELHSQWTHLLMEEFFRQVRYHSEIRYGNMND